MSIVRPFACFVFLLTASGCGDGGGKANAPLTGAALGQQLFTQCGICHSPADPATAAGQIRLTGPNLWNVVGRPSASFDGYAYSPAMRKAGLVWDEQTLDRFLDTPQMVVPGTRMSFAGVHDAGERQAIIDYLKTLKPSSTDQSQD
ncbi:MAG: c-type cytochrome [Caulobacterales bacterium]|nr:c-type cytochrome [Caulobacterales bacterium]HRX39664.1 c-type cytochrome [Parvularculaceae bacterium]